MRVEETFSVNRRPEVVFDYLTDPSTLADWQTSKTSVQQLTEGPPRLGTRVRERTKPPGGKEFEQVVEPVRRLSPQPAPQRRARLTATGGRLLAVGNLVVGGERRAHAADSMARS
jgi:hypothetical protein